MKKTIKVVGAIIENDKNEILCALRSPDMSLPNMWEFPGGKVEDDEELDEAIIREIDEELGCIIESVEVFYDTLYEYDEIIVNLITLKCKIKSGGPVASEHSKLIWLRRENLKSLKWALADISTVDKLVNEER